MAILRKEVYEKNKNLYQPKYIKWDASKKTFVQADKKDFKISIKPLAGLSSSTKNALKYVIKLWKNEIEDTTSKDYTKNPAGVNRILYNNTIGNHIISYLSKPIDEINNNKNTYFCCWIKNKDLYLSITIFSINTDGKDGPAHIEFCLTYPQSQIDSNKRQNGTFGACSYNSMVVMINYIFQNYNVKNLNSYPLNKDNEQSLEKLGFTKS